MFLRHSLLVTISLVVVLITTDVFAQQGQRISDLQVKSIKLSKRSGNSWVATTKVSSGPQYKMDVVFGNPGRYSFPEDRYKKINLDIRVVFKGFKVVNSYLHADKIRVYTDATYSTVSSNTRATFQLPELKTTHADVQFTAYIKFSGSLDNMPTNLIKWNCGTYGFVRDMKWREEATE